MGAHKNFADFKYRDSFWNTVAACSSRWFLSEIREKLFYTDKAFDMHSIEACGNNVWVSNLYKNIVPT